MMWARALMPQHDSDSNAIQLNCWSIGREICCVLDARQALVLKARYRILDS